MGYEISKEIFFILICLFVSLNVFLVNIVLHEAGHYIAAENFGLEPEIKFDFGVGNLSFGFEGKALASTSFDEPSNRGELFFVSIAGPLVNLIFGIIFSIVYFFVRDSKVRLLIIICVIVSLISFVMNMLPLWGTDGSIVFGAI